MHQPSRPSMVRSHRLVVALAALTSLVGQAASATTLVNGSLESPSASFIQTVAAGQSANGWSVIGANIEFVRAGYSNGADTVAPAADGDWFVDLNGTQGPGRIAQTFDTVAGQWYRIDFAMSGNAGPGGATAADGSKSLNVLWNGGTAASATYLHQPGDRWDNLRWEWHDVLVQATGSSSTLTFQSASSFYSAAGALVDAIQVTAVPEPGTAAMLLAGLAMGTVLRRRQPR